MQANAAGDPAGARKWLCALGEEQRESILPLFPVEITDDTHLARIALATNDQELATSAMATAELRSELNPAARTIAATAAHVRGLLTGDDRLLAHAVELLPAPLAGAGLGTRGSRGAAHLRSARTEEGIEVLGSALSIYAGCGAVWDSRRVRSRLRAHGVRRRLVTPEREETGWAAMTDSELAVARLVTQGLTNREVAEQLFVSPHTVSSHLRRVFSKLGINSRVALTLLAGDEGRRS